MENIDLLLSHLAISIADATQRKPMLCLVGEPAADERAFLEDLLCTLTATAEFAFSVPFRYPEWLGIAPSSVPLISVENVVENAYTLAGITSSEPEKSILHKAVVTQWSEALVIADLVDLESFNFVVGAMATAVSRFSQETRLPLLCASFSSYRKIAGLVELNIRAGETSEGFIVLDQHQSDMFVDIAKGISERSCQS